MLSRCGIVIDMARLIDSTALTRIAAGGRLRTAMKRRGFNTTMLSNWTGISAGTIHHFLEGTRDMHLDDMRKIEKALGVSAAWIAWGKK